jgi:16S rRNA (cytosine1402-N4)-methyltransferase
VYDLSEPLHEPVLVKPVVEFLLAPQTRVIIDATLGDGGHSLALLQDGRSQFRLIGIDADPQALAVARARLESYASYCNFVNGNFRDLAKLLEPLGVTSVDGILADLGVSSRQIDFPERGFSYREDGPLDMRMNPNLPHTAADLLATLEKDELKRIFREYGEEKLAAPIARAIVQQRSKNPLTRTNDLRRVVEKIVKGSQQVKSLARIFQALRIAVNDELAALQTFLEQALALLRPGGRLAVISYHSLEDRIVKQFFKAQAKGCTCPPEFPVCVCGKNPQLVVLTPKPVAPGPEEVKLNRRARSARLRVAQKRRRP